VNSDSLQNSIDKLEVRLRRIYSFKGQLFVGIISGVGFAIGTTIIAALLFWGLNKIFHFNLPLPDRYIEQVTK